jgi:predicted MFS family arabinose efflux permease
LPIKNYPWKALISSYICALVFAFALQSISPILPLIITELNLSYTEAGLLMSFSALPAILFSLSAGLLADRWGSYRVGATSFILVTVGILIFAMSNSFISASIGRVITGISAMAISIVGTQIISKAFERNRIGAALGLYGTAVPFGVVVCLATFGNIGEILGWRTPIYITAAISVAGLIAFLLLHKTETKFTQNTFNTDERKTDLFPKIFNIGGNIWLVGLCWMWFNAAFVSFITFAPDFLITEGYTIGSAGLITSLIMGGALVFTPFIGRLIDRVQNNELFIGAAGIISASAIFIVTQSSNFIIAIILLSIGQVFMPTSIFSLPSKILKPQYFGLAFGIINMVNNIGVLGGPFIAGLVRDMTGSYEQVFYILSIFAILSTLSAIVLRIWNRKLKQYPTN